MSHNLWSTGHSDTDSPFLSAGDNHCSGNPTHQQNLEMLRSCAHPAQQQAAGQDTKRRRWHQSLFPRNKESMSQLHNQSPHRQYLSQHQDITLGSVEETTGASLPTGLTLPINSMLSERAHPWPHAPPETTAEPHPYGHGCRMCRQQSRQQMAAFLLHALEVKVLKWQNTLFVTLVLWFKRAPCCWSNLWCSAPQ